MAELSRSYRQGFMAALAHTATRHRHLIALQHALRALHGALDPASQTELRDAVDGYGRGQVPLVLPIDLIRQHASVLGIEYLEGQVYLEPHPRESMIRKLL